MDRLFGKIWFAAMSVGILAGICVQNLCLTIGCGFALVAVCLKDWR